jgi:hypothetical protein
MGQHWWIEVVSELALECCTHDRAAVRASANTSVTTHLARNAARS